MKALSFPTRCPTFRLLAESLPYFSTAASAAGLSLPKNLEGIRFKPLLAEPARSWKPAAFSRYPRKVGRQNRMGYAMRTDRHQFTHWVNLADHTEVVAEEVYGLQTNPEENTIIAGKPENKGLVEKLTAPRPAGWQGVIAQLHRSKPST